MQIMFGNTVQYKQPGQTEVNKFCELTGLKGLAAKMCCKRSRLLNELSQKPAKVLGGRGYRDYHTNIRVKMGRQHQQIFDAGKPYGKSSTSLTRCSSCRNYGSTELNN